MSDMAMAGSRGSCGGAHIWGLENQSLCNKIRFDPKYKKDPGVRGHAVAYL